MNYRNLYCISGLVTKVCIATHDGWIDVKFSTSCIFLFILVVLKLLLCSVKFFSVVNPTKIGSYILDFLDIGLLEPLFKVNSLSFYKLNICSNMNI